jgi:hypothetical protein
VHMMWLSIWKRKLWDNMLPTLMWRVHKFFWEVKNGDVDRTQLYECQQHMVATRRIKFNLFHIEIWLWLNIVTCHAIVLNVKMTMWTLNVNNLPMSSHEP